MKSFPAPVTAWQPSPVSRSKRPRTPGSSNVAVAKSALVSLDLDFANPLHFKPSRYSGIAVLRLPRKPSHADLLDAVRTLAAGLEREKLDGKLWVIEARRIRVFQEQESD